MGDIPRRRMRSASVAIGVTALAAAALSGCSSSPDYNAVCIDDTTQQRVSDSECDDDSYGSTYRWYYIGSGQRIPAVGSPVSGGSYTDPGSSSHDYGGFGGRGSGISS